MKILAEAFFLVAIAILQCQWENHLSVYGISPDFIFAAALALSAFLPPSRGSLWAFFAGIYADMYYGSPLGANALVYTLSSWLFQKVSQRFDLYDHLTQAIAMLIFSFPACILCWILSALFANDTWFSWKYVCLVPFFNAAAAPFLFPAVLGIKRFLHMEERF